MIFRSSYKGPGMVKYGVFAIIIKLIVFGLWIMFAIIPYGGEFLDIMSNSLNIGVWDLKELLTPIFYILIWFVALVVVESAIGFGIFYIAKNELESRNRGRIF